MATIIPPTTPKLSAPAVVAHTLNNSILLQVIERKPIMFSEELTTDPQNIFTAVNRLYSNSAFMAVYSQ